MLNRLYIVVGVLAILVLGAGFLVPRLIDWSGYRSRLEALAETSLGTDIIISGDIDFILLPQPQIRLGTTIVGPALSPLAEIESIVADFSLMDFLRDRFTITRLVLQSPTVNLTVDRDGKFQIPLELPQTVSTSNISVAVADIKDGLLRFTDMRSDQSYVFKSFDGAVSVSALRGPYNLQGLGAYGGANHVVRLSVSAMNQSNEAQTSFFIKPETGEFSFAGEGLLELNSAPKFVGETVFRQAGNITDEAERVSGDFVFTSQIEASSDKILLSAFELQPDETQSGSRLSGAAVVRLGELQSFDAVISGGVVTLAPADIRAQSSSDPHEIVQFLTQLSVPPVPGMLGRVGVDIAELGIRNMALRNVRLDATTDGNNWSLDSLFADLPGDSQLRLSGELSQNGGAFGYQGTLNLQSERLGSLVKLWRQVDIASPLHNAAGVIGADLTFENNILSISEGALTLDEITHSFAGQFALEGSRSALLSLRLEPVNDRQSVVLAALVPDVFAGAGFAQSFPEGSLDLVAEQATLFGMSGKSLALQVDWGASGLHIERLSAVDLGGAQIAVTGEVTGTVLEPVISGGGRVTLSESAQHGFLEVISTQSGFPKEFLNLVQRSLPIDANLDIGPIEEDGAQVFSALGRANVADFELDLRMENGVRNFYRDPLVFNGTMHADNQDALTVQLGIGEVSLLGFGAPIDIALNANGTISNSVEIDVFGKVGEDHIGYSGMLIVSDLADLRGQGVLDFALSDFGPLTELAGAEGISIPQASGSVDVNFTMNRAYAFENLIVFGEEDDESLFSGQFTWTKEGESALVAGQFETGNVEVRQLMGVLGGGASLLRGEGFWPEGPIDLGNVRRDSRGRIGIQTPQIMHGEKLLASDVAYNLVWSETSVGLENIKGTSGAGEVSGSLNLCCSAVGGQKQMSGRLSLDGVPVAGIAPEGISQNLEGILGAGVAFESTGSSLMEMANALTGEGSFMLHEARIERFDPAAFETLATTPNLAELDADALQNLMGIALDQASFDAPAISGVFQIAGGKLRADNVAAFGNGGQLLGDVRIDLADLTLSGNWQLSPSELEDPTGLVEQTNAQIIAVLGGTIIAPTRNLDTGQMAEAIQMRVLEIELDRLEQLQAEQVARSTAAALERARLMELEAQRAAEEAARLAAEAEQRRLNEAAAAEAARLAAEQGPLLFDFDSQDPLLFDLQPIDLQPTDSTPQN